MLELSSQGGGCLRAPFNAVALGFLNVLPVVGVRMTAGPFKRGKYGRT